jgi:hypothetical protein
MAEGRANPPHRPPKEQLVGLFRGKKPPDPTPVRRSEVMKLLKAGMDEVEAADRVDDGPEYARQYAAADKRRQEAFKAATPAERKAAQEALRRNGYS